MRINLNPAIETYRASVIAEIEAAAARARAAVLTDGAPYAEKLAEARAWAAGTISDPPYLSAEAAAREVSIDDVADLVLDAAARDEAVLVAVEADRQRRKLAARAATTHAHLAAIAAELTMS